MKNKTVNPNMIYKKAEKKLQDPFFFMSEILGIKYLTYEQRLIVKSVWENKYTGVRAAHSVGKTFLAAAIVLAFIVANKDSVAITTAPTRRQVKDLLWKEIANLHNKAFAPIGGTINTMSFELGPKWFAVGVATDPGKESESAVQMQGYHAPKILFVLDEAVGIKPQIWEAVDGITNSEDARVLAIGNPSTVSCTFKKLLDSKEWNSLQINALNHPNVVEKKEVVPGAVSYAWVKQKVGKWCELTTEHNPSLHTFDFEGQTYIPSSLFQWKVLGEFPESASDTLIPANKVQEAMNREFAVHEEACYLGIDVARFGTDTSVFTSNINNVFTQAIVYHLDITTLTDIAIKLIRENKYIRIAVDCDGIGAGLFDNIKRMRDEESITDDDGNIIEFQLIEIHSGGKPYELGQTELFLNLRAQMYWMFKFDIDKIKIDYDEELEEEMSTIKYYYNVAGKIQIEAKEEIKKRLGRSPDKLESLLYCNWCKYAQSDITQVCEPRADNYVPLMQRLGQPKNGMYSPPSSKLKNIII